MINQYGCDLQSGKDFQGTNANQLAKGKPQTNQCIELQEINPDIENNPNRETHNNANLPLSQQKEIITETNINCCTAVLILLVNLILPGVGTMIASCMLKDPKLKREFCLNGVCQLVTAPCLVGWCMALVYSIVLISVSGDDYANMEKKKNAITPQNK